jgi:parallel beta-helix repeat protein
MKKCLITILFVLITTLLFATNYYVSANSGSDTNDGKSADSAWKSIAKLNRVRSNLLPGDSVLFHCNDTLYGQVIVSKSGTAGNIIYYGSYGSGNKPVISGKTVVNNWTQSSANIWNAQCPNCIGSVTNFFINDIPQQIGRWPNVTDANKGYRTFNSHTGKTKITDKNLSDAINWTGAEAVVRSVRWELNRFTIKSQNKGTLEFTTNGTYEFLNGFGYFIQNDPRTLDQQGEWYFNPTNKQFTIFSQTDPNTFVTKTTNCDTLMKLIGGVKYITIENLHFDGAGMVAFHSYYSCNYIIFRNNDITFSGINAVETEGSDFFTFENNLINKTNNNALRMPDADHLIIRNNIIKNTALVAGMGLSGWNYFAMSIVYGKDYLIEYNTIDSAGYCGLELTGDSCLVRNNVFSNFCLVKDDGGGIYGGGSYKGDTSIIYSKKLIGNIVYNAIGAPEGTNWPGSMAEGIYMDGGLNDDILNNTVFNCSGNGIKIHVSNHINIKGNNVYNNGEQMHFEQNPGGSAISNCLIDSNNFVSKLAAQQIMGITTVNNYIPDLGSFDYNYYCRPFDNSQMMQLNYYMGTNMNIEVHTLKSWSSQYNKDLHSGESPIAVNAYTVNSVNSSNYIPNGSFDSNTTGWYSWANYNNSKLSFAPGGGITGGAIHTEFTPPSGKADGYMYLISNNFAFSTDKTYRLRFVVKSNKAETSTLQVIPRKNGNPYNLVADQKNFSIDSTYKQYEYVFTPYLIEPNARIDFQITEGQGDLWFDNIELAEVDATKTNPDDYIRFEYNATKMDTTIALKDSYVDVKGMPVSGNITLKPFTSVILFKKICSGIVPARPDTIIGDLIVCPGSPVTYNIAPVPGATYYKWKLPNGWTGTSTGYDIKTIAGDTDGVISVMARNVCDSSLVKTLNVTVNSSKAPDQPEDISGNTSICAGTTNTYSIAAVSQATNYTWKLPDGWTGTSITNSINAMADEAGGNITVTANNRCGSSTAKTLSVTVNPIPATPVITMNNGILHSNATNGNQWYFKNQIIPNATNASYVPLLKSFYYVVITLNGCSSESSNIIWVNPTGIDETVDNKEIKVYPNPTTGMVRIILNNHFSSDYSVDIYDNVGGLLQTLMKDRSVVNFDLDLSGYSTGVYLIHIFNSYKNFQTKVIKE